MTKPLLGILGILAQRVRLNFEAFLWVILGQIEKQIIELHQDSVTKVNFNHNGTLFATADMLGKIFIFDAATNAMLYDVINFLLIEF